SRRNDQNGRAPGTGWGPGLPRQPDRLVRGPVPVLDEGELGRERRGSLDPDVRVAPGTEIRVAAEILVPDVVPPDPGRASVHHHDLTVVAEIELQAVAGAAP